ncbi:site-specific integrase [Chelatococcus sp. CO-6]|uniref:site-specific integrase n=1 Tax=Chelatococcus sp. CO-6 TaxID=1702325 RepID=UPI0009EB8033|nr:site-specific integrase [Chelatococcus sp. CO-6]
MEAAYRHHRRPAPAIRIPVRSSRHRGEREAPWLTHAELAMLRAAATGRLADFIEIAYYTASRKRAVETLQWSQVRLAEGKIHLAKVGERKTKKRRPIVPIDAELRPTLERLHQEHVAEKRATDWVLGTPTSLYRPFVKLCASLGIKASPHILRHTRATHLLMDGVSIYDVARLLGDTVPTVERVYGHHSAEYLAKSIEKKKGKRNGEGREAA